MKKTDMVTKKDMFNYLVEVLPENAEFRKGETLVTRQNIVEFIENELALLEKKASSKSNKPTKTQEENEKLKNEIIEKMAVDTIYTLKEITKLLDPTGEKEFTTSKMSALMKQLVASGLVTKEYDKKTPLYKKNSGIY